MKAHKLKLVAIASLFLAIVLFPGTAFAIPVGPFELESDDTAHYDEASGTLILHDDTTTTIIGMVEGSTLPRKIGTAPYESASLMLKGNNIEITGASGLNSIVINGGSAELSGLNYSGELLIVAQATVTIQDSKVGDITLISGALTVEDSRMYLLNFSGSETSLTLKPGTDIEGALKTLDEGTGIPTLDISSLSTNSPIPIAYVMFDGSDCDTRIIVPSGTTSLKDLIESDNWTLRMTHLVYSEGYLVGTLNNDDASINYFPLCPSFWLESDSYVLGSNNTLSLSCDTEFEPEALIYVDGAELQNGEASLSSGSTVVTLSSAYLEQLPVGSHTIRVIFPGGKVYAESTFAIAETTPDTIEDENKLAATGDTSQHAGILVVASLGLLLFASFKRRIDKQ